MIDPVIFTIGNFPLRWYGVIVMTGVIVGSLLVERKLKEHGENSDTIWDALVWVLPIGILGARLWYVLNATIGGSTAYTNNPAEIFYIWHGGLHIFGGFVFGGATLLLYLNKNKLDPWLFLDAAGPAMLIGQAIGRIANFINQELYGPPTTLPWGIPITNIDNRLTQYKDLIKYPIETTRFHPTFAYEMIWNISAASLLLWLARRYKDEIKPGTLFAGWLLLAGTGRAWIELFRPDQPKIDGTIVSYSMIVSALMAIVGAVMLMARYKAINLSGAENWEDEYKIAPRPETASEQATAAEIEVEDPDAEPETEKPVKARKPSTRKKTAITKVEPKKQVRKSTNKSSSTTVKRTTKSSTKKKS